MYILYKKEKNGNQLMSNYSRLIHHIFCIEALIPEHLISLTELISTKKDLKFSKEPND